MSNNNTILFKDLANDWLIQKKITVKNSTFVKYQNTLNKHILPALGDIPLDSLNNHLIMDFINTKLLSGDAAITECLSHKTVKDLLVLINNILKYGEIYYPQQIPTIRIVYPTIVKSEIRILSHLEQYHLEQVLYQDINAVKLGILICMHTGLRIGEICGLRWADISICDGTISIKRTVQRLQTFSSDDGPKTRICIDTPKTSNSLRKIPIPGFLISLLEEFYPPCSDAFILTGDEFSCMEPRTLENYFNNYMALAKELCTRNPQYTPQSGKLTFHSLRHTFATRCVEAGFEIKCLSEILGHANVNITLNRYVHSSLQMKRENMKKLVSVYHHKGEE